ncbi:hypothetical protein Sango_2060300 [Sesamum angolense]|uniref:Retrovirus-related Pol polyprotein from transposon TNT 1-94-like beta-barrel domain-containing protein n=1 Tax=Sesamum angolense TaxID=2727404 RepID=A0AAE1WAU9_9LAMI|nr:hypothetical protein Sango_2060300 [Sesamum angolense]
MYVPVMRTLPDLSKMELLDGTNFKHWSQKLLIFFEQLDVDYVLFQNPPETPVEASIIAITTADTTSIGTTKGDDAGRKKYVVGKWLQFQMIDEKPIMDQIHEYENLVADVLREGMKMCEILQANVLLEKFPPTWSEYRNHLKHKKRDLTLQELISHMRIEEANRLKDEETSLSSLSIKANLVESAGTKDRFYQNKGKKFQKNNHHKSFKATDVVVEPNLVENKEDWILDTGASRHFCSNKTLFHKLLETTDGECVFMGNSTTAGVLVEDDPKTYMEATSIDSSFWKEAIRNELDSIMMNHTWDLVDLPIGKTIKETIRFLSAQFDMKDLGEADVILGQEAEWLKNLLGDVPLWGSTVPVSLHSDSQAAIGIAMNYAYNGKRRYIRIRHGAVKELLKNGIISLEYVRSKRNLADPLTKGLTRRIIFESSRAMGLKPLD